MLCILAMVQSLFRAYVCGCVAIQEVLNFLHNIILLLLQTMATLKGSYNYYTSTLGMHSVCSISWKSGSDNLQSCFSSIAIIMPCVDIHNYLQYSNQLLKANRIACICVVMYMCLLICICVASQTAHLLNLSMVMSVPCIKEFAVSILMS